MLSWTQMQNRCWSEIKAEVEKEPRSVHCKDKNSSSLLHLAVEDKNIEMVSFLLDHSAPVNYKTYDSNINSGGSALFIAATLQQTEIVNLLIARGADVNISNCYGETPLHAAADSGNASICELLLDRAARADSRNSYGITPLMLASFRGLCGIMKRLIAAGVDVHYRNQKEENALHYACASGCLEGVRLLLEQKAGVHVPNSMGWTPLHFAAFHNSCDIAEELLKHGADPKRRDNCQATVLHFAAEHGTLPLVRLLMECGADVSAMDVFKSRPLHLAKDEEIMEFLLKNGASPNQMNQHGSTPLLNAAGSNRTDLVKLMLRFGGDPNLHRERGHAALHESVSCTFADGTAVVEALIAHGADVNLKCTETPLEIALRIKNSWAVDVLIANGAILQERELCDSQPGAGGHAAHLPGAVQWPDARASSLSERAQGKAQPTEQPGEEADPEQLW